MQRCSKKAYAKCPTRHLCGSIDEAIFSDNSECAAFNRKVESQPMTKGDKIRAMSDEELAKEFVNFFISGVEAVRGALPTILNRTNLEQMVLKRLREPVEQGDDRQPSTLADSKNAIDGKLSALV